MKARKFFRMMTESGYGYLLRLGEKKKRTIRDEEIRDARQTYQMGIMEAWNTYTRDNEVVQKAKKTLDDRIHKSFTLWHEHEDEMSTAEYNAAKRSYVQEVFKAHDDFAEEIKDTWNIFIKDMEKANV